MYSDVRVERDAGELDSDDSKDGGNDDDDDDRNDDDDEDDAWPTLNGLQQIISAEKRMVKRMKMKMIMMMILTMMTLSKTAILIYNCKKADFCPRRNL